jgi:hypothetical protein
MLNTSLFFFWTFSFFCSKMGSRFSPRSGVEEVGEATAEVGGAALPPC